MNSRAMLPALMAVLASGQSSGRATYTHNGLSDLRISDDNKNACQQTRRQADHAMEKAIAKRERKVDQNFYRASNGGLKLRAEEPSE